MNQVEERKRKEELLLLREITKQNRLKRLEEKQNEYDELMELRLKLEKEYADMDDAHQDIDQVAVGEDDVKPIELAPAKKLHIPPFTGTN